MVLEVDSTGVVTASGNLDIFKKKTQETSKSTNTLDDAMRGMNLSALASTAGVIGLYKALQSTISGMKNFAMQSINAFSSFETMQMGLETFFQSAEKGKEVFEDLRKLSNQTTFGVDELANSATQLLNVGVGASSINDTLIMIGNTAQGDKQKFAELTSIYAKIQSTGKAGSVQLQQLAMKGLPIYDILKKIGVQGTATASDIQKAFQEMTKEGGQFYNAMENINRTIEGKKGFISDYFKEFLVNFAEVTGIADMYKQILDVVADAIAGVSDWLLKINDNPIMKALFNGALVTAITMLVTALATAIGGTLIVAIKNLNAQLFKTVALSTILNPKVLITAGIVGGIAGIAMAFTKYQKTLDETKEKQDKVFNPSVDIHDWNNALDDKAVEYAKKLLELYQNNVSDIESQIKENEKKINYNPEDYRSNYVGDTVALRNKYKAESENVVLNEQKAKWENLLKSQEKVVKGHEDSLKYLENQKSLIEKINEAYSQTPIGKLKAEIKQVSDKIQELQKSSKSGIFTGLEEELQYTIQELQNQKLELEIKLNLTNLEEYQEKLIQLYGLTDKQASDLKNNGQLTTVGVSNFSEENFNKTNELQKQYAEYTGYSEYDALSEYLQKLKDNLKSMLDSGVWDGTEESLKTLTQEISDTEARLQSFGETALTFNDFLSASMKEKVMSSSGDLQAFAEGAQSGGIWGGLINTIINALWTVCSEVEGFGEVINPITTLFRNLNVLIYNVMTALSDILSIIMDVARVINTILAIFQPIVDFMNAIGKVITNGINKFVNGFVDIISSIFPWVSETIKRTDDEVKKEKERQAQRDLTDQYKALLQALKETEEYYDERKAQLRGRQAIDNVTRVNDMILTPQGNFSTAPDDYIIATKNPSALGGNGSVVMNVKINNTQSDKVTATATQSVDENGFVQLLVDISQKVASDFAKGSNGWDSALAYRQVQTNGRRVTI